MVSPYIHRRGKDLGMQYNRTGVKCIAVFKVGQV